MKKLLPLLVPILLFLSCTKEIKEDNIVVTTNIIASSIKEIIGEDVKIITLMNSETDPHSYQASPKDFQTLSNASIIISNGLHLEGKLHETIVNSAKNNRSKHIQVSDTLTKSELIIEENNVADPHIWFDQLKWKKCIRYTVLELIKLYPEHKSKWLEKLEAFELKIDASHKETILLINSIPDSSKVLITAHDAFSYFSLAYNIKIKPLQGRNTMSEPSIKDVMELSDYIVKNKIKAIFVETTVNKKFIESIKESCISKGHHVVIGGNLYSDALGPENSPESTYLGMINYNVKTIVNALK